MYMTQDSSPRTIKIKQKKKAWICKEMSRCLQASTTLSEDLNSVPSVKNKSRLARKRPVLQLGCLDKQTFTLDPGCGGASRDQKCVQLCFLTRAVTVSFPKLAGPPLHSLIQLAWHTGTERGGEIGSQLQVIEFLG